MMLHCFVQNYHWGKKGSSSEVAQLAAANRTGFVIDEGKPYAELWIGTHRSGPSVIMDTGLLLIDYLKKNPAVLGYEVKEKFGDLPFLLKVLSVDKTLSIQAHPTKEHAVQLHKKMPDIYTDANHKPEMAIALTEFSALCGFRPIHEIKKFLRDVFDLRRLIGEETVADFLASDEANLQTKLKSVFHILMTATPEIVTIHVNNLVSWLKTLDEPTRESLCAGLVERLNNQYPGDVGVFGAYFFNHIVLQPGQAMFLGPDEPHAYIYGDCIECMACSDNVVRAGLTPKRKDIVTLCEMLTYICEPPQNKLINGISEDKYTTLFKPPVEDFAVASININEPVNYVMIARRSATLCVVIKGKGSINKKDIHRGSVFFTHAGQTNLLTTTEPLLMFQALANM